MTRGALGWFGVAFTLASGLVACGSSEDRGDGDGTAASGGTAGTGGTPTTGGAATTGGTPSTGGAASGGTPSTGGTSSTGGAATGGTAGTGGTPTTGGVANTGGVATTGGAPSTGGVATTGGTQGTGGTPSTGGVATTGGTQGTGGTPSTGGVSTTGGVANTGGTPTTGGVANTGGGAGQANCVSCSLLGDAQLRIGASMADETAAAAPFDVRYLYIAGVVPALGDCSGCSEACGDWWGCWQDWAQPPGQYVTSFVDRCASATWQGNARPQLPFITYYVQLPASGLSEGEAQVAALDDAQFLARYLGDWRLLLQQIGSHPAMLHIEPDLWGYIRSVDPDPHSVPAQVTAANPTDCAAQEDSAAGLARCMIHMARLYAPNAAVGLHASPWLIDVAGDGAETGAFMAALGAGDGDFIVADTADRDAGYYESQGRDTWWHDDADAQRFLDWVSDVAEAVCRPAVVWQIPVGNMAQANTTDHWQDTRVDWLFGHLPAVADAHVAALLFGAGAGGMTTPETDGGNLIAQTIAYRAAGGTAICQ